MEENAARRTPPKAKLVMIVALVVLAAVSVVLVLARGVMYRLEAVYVLGNEQRSSESIVLLAGLSLGQNSMEIHEEDIRKALSKDYTLIFEGMYRESPHVITLRIKERKPVAILYRLGVYYTLDEEGMVMAEVDKGVDMAGMPMINGLSPTNVLVGQMMMVPNAKQMQAYREITRELTLQAYADQIESVNLSDAGNITMRLNITRDEHLPVSTALSARSEGITVRLGDSSYMRAKIGAIKTDVAYLYATGNYAGTLDVSIPEDAKFKPDSL